MLWLTYDTVIGYSHKLRDVEWVTDKACLDVHDHQRVALQFKIQALPDVDIDFKEINKIVENIIFKYHQVNISEKFEIYSTEEFVCRIVDEVETVFGHTRKVRLHLQETQKYGVTVE